MAEVVREVCPASGGPWLKLLLLFQVAYDNDPLAGLSGLAVGDAARQVLGGEAAMWGEQADPSGASTKVRSRPGVLRPAKARQRRDGHPLALLVLALVVADVAARRRRRGEALVRRPGDPVDRCAAAVRAAPRPDGPPRHALRSCTARVVHAARGRVLLTPAAASGSAQSFSFYVLMFYALGHADRSRFGFVS